MDNTSAATLVGAVLEQAGYISQSKLLDAFEGFFLSAGQLIYLIAIVGALTSFAVMGSARLGRYLIVGPVFFWLLISPRSSIDGVQWRVDNELRSMGEVSSKDIIDHTTYADSDLKISTAFKLYVKFVDNVVSESVKVITAQVDKRGAFFSDRATALNTIINAQMSNPTVVGLYDNLLWGKGADDLNGQAPCAELMLRALAGAPAVAREESVDSLQQNIALAVGAVANQGDYSERFAKIKENREQFIKAYENVETQARVVANPVMRKFLTDYKDNPTLQPLYQKVISKGDPMACREVWDAIAVGVSMEAELLSDQLKEEYRTKWSQVGVAEGELDRYQSDFCKDIASKMGQKVEKEEDCSLVPLFFIQMMRNATGPDHLSHILNRHKDRGSFVRRDKGSGFIPMNSSSPSEWQLDMDAAGNPIYEPQEGGGKADGEESKRRVQFSNAKGEKAFYQAAEMMDVDDQFGNAFNNSLKMQLEEIRNKLFAFALELPYWQGLILYIVSFIYPVCALVVLLPGRAVNFFRILLFWLWAKSWDIGFALAYVFEQVLWNLIPQGFTANESFSAMARSPDQIQSLVTFYADTLRLDPSYNVYIYYWALSLVVLAIPGITGAVILKGQRSALSSLSDGVNTMASMVGERGKGAAGLIIGNKNILGAQHTMGMAGLSMTPQSGSIASWLGRGSLETPLAYGAIGAGSKYFRDAAKGEGSLVGGAATAALGVAAAVANSDSVSGGPSAAQGSSSGSAEGNSDKSAIRRGAEAAWQRINQLDPEEKAAIGGMALLGLANGTFGSFATDPDQTEGVKVKGGKTYVSKATDEIVKLLQADTGFRSAFERVYGEHGRYSAHYTDYQAITASADPKGGFEMDNYNIEILNEATNSFKTQVESLRGAAKDTIVGTVLSTASGRLLPSVVVGAAVVFSAKEIAEGIVGGGQEDTSSPITTHFMSGDQSPLTIDGKTYTNAAVEDYFNRSLYGRAPSADDMSVLYNGFQSPLGGNDQADPILSKYVPNYQGNAGYEKLADKTFITDDAANKAVALTFLRSADAKSISDAFGPAPTPKSQGEVH